MPFAELGDSSSLLVGQVNDHRPYTIFYAAAAADHDDYDAEVHSSVRCRVGYQSRNKR